ncbi:MAG: MFS transporter [Bacillus subtilis]|nr:MFS transporter [Bacillus subtilis]
MPASIIGGKLTDKIGRKKIIVIFDLITEALFILAGLLPFSFGTLVIIFIGGLFQQMEGPAYQALVADFSAPQDREKAFSLSYLGFNLGFMIGPTLGGLLFTNHIGLSFIINALSTLVSTILIAFFVFEKTRSRTRRRPSRVANMSWPTRRHRLGRSSKAARSSSA